jgi:C4-dicarboxylate-specific signal transduction histidine kinase
MTASGDFSYERLRLVEKLAAGVAHEVNNPLQSVLNNAYLIEASTDQPNIAGYATEIQRANAVLSQLLGALLDLLRPERTSRALEVVQAIDGALALLGYALRNAQVSVRVQLEAGAVRVNGDPGLLELALLDLLSAALEGEKLDGEIQRDRLITLAVSRSHSRGSDWLEFNVTVRGAAEPACPLARNVAERWGGVLHAESVPGAAVCKLVLSLPAATA